MAQTQGVEEREFLVKVVVQVFCRLAVILLAATSASHGDHQVLVKPLAKADSGGAHALGQPALAVLLDGRQVHNAMVGLTIRQQQHARDTVFRPAFELVGTGLPAGKQVCAAAALNAGNGMGDLVQRGHWCQGTRHLNLTVVQHHRHLIGWGHSAGDVLDTAQRLGEWAATHAARAVHHQGQALGWAGAVGCTLGSRLIRGLDPHDQVQRAATHRYGGGDGGDEDGGGGR